MHYRDLAKAFGPPEDPRGRLDMGFASPPLTQAAATPPLLERVVGTPVTGTGGTRDSVCRFMIVDADERDVQALVLAPPVSSRCRAPRRPRISPHAISPDVVRLRYFALRPADRQRSSALRLSSALRVASSTSSRRALDLSNACMLVPDAGRRNAAYGLLLRMETIASSAPDDRLTALFSATEAAHENEPRLAVPSCHGRR